MPSRSASSSPRTPRFHRHHPAIEVAATEAAGRLATAPTATPAQWHLIPNGKLCRLRQPASNRCGSQFIPLIQARFSLRVKWASLRLRLPCAARRLCPSVAFATLPNAPFLFFMFCLVCLRTLRAQKALDPLRKQVLHHGNLLSCPRVELTSCNPPELCLPLRTTGSLTVMLPPNF